MVKEELIAVDGAGDVVVVLGAARELGIRVESVIVGQDTARGLTHRNRAHRHIWTRSTASAKAKDSTRSALCDKQSK